ncbi:MAG: hypothetical protein GX639_18880 [Fibrobacter sp.]|nr:hypothetical protein [Fibrobacter sp.]
MHAYPNLFVKTATVQFTIPFVDNTSQSSNNRWSLELYTCLRRCIKKIAEGNVSTGTHRVSVNPEQDKFKVFAQGTYFCVLRVLGQEQAVKLVRVR